KAATETTLGLLNTKAATEATLAVPSSATTITPNDSTDTTTITAKGLIVGTSGNLSIQSLGTPGVTVAFAVVVGQYVPIKCSKVMAATTAVVIGLS
ncbi:MAG: spike base protein, RCAP_Rcc01079 family, partial [Bacteroidales bacterium]